MGNTLTVFDGSDSGLFRVSTDVVIFAVQDETLQVLLHRRPSASFKRTFWALPGGYVKARQPLEESAEHTLAEQTGVRDVYLEQLYTFGQPDRHPASRVISVAYFALVSGDGAAAVEIGSTSAWWRVDGLPDLYLDHDRIISTARERLSAKMEYSTIGFQLMPEYFTLSELQQVYEIIHDRPIDKRNFRRRMLAMEHLVATEQCRRNGSHRPARLYRYTARDAVHYLK